MTPRIYSNIAVQTSLVSGITAAATSLTVAGATGYPVAPFALVVDPGSATYEEVMLVTAKAGTTFTVTRGYDGTTAKAHAAGALVIHAAIADDFRGMQLGTREVSSAAPSDNQGLVWDNANSIWEPGTPSPGGGAGGVLSGTYPNPGFAVNMAEQSELDAHTALTTTAHDGIVPQSRTLTINGTTFDLSADRSWTVTGGVSSVTATTPLQSSGGATPNISFVNQAANLVLAGPASGGAAAPTFRALVKADLLSAIAYEDEANTFTATQAIAIDDAVTNTTTTLATLRHTSTGTPAASFGSRLLWQLESSTTVNQDAAAIDVIWTNATHANRTSALVFSTVNNGGALAGGVRITGQGWLQIGSTTATAPLHISTSAGNSVDGGITMSFVSSYTGGSSQNGAFFDLQATNSAVSGYVGFFARAKTGGSATSANQLTGFSAISLMQATSGTITNAFGADLSVTNSNAGTITNAIALRCRVTNTGAGTITTEHAINIVSPSNSGGGTVTTATGLNIEDITIGGTNYAIRTNAGLIVFNEGGNANSDVRIEGDTLQNLFFTDASTDRIGVNTNAPNSLLDVAGALQCDSLRVDVTPVAETPAATHTAVINFNGTNYKVLCLAA